MCNHIKSLTIGLLWLPLAVLAASPAPHYCELNLEEEYWAAWQRCEGQLVKIMGQVATLPMQHPTGLHNQMNLDTGGFETRYETYVNMQDAQLVVTSDAPINCSAAIVVEGIVDIVELGGEKGKSSYKNVWLKLQQYECR